MILGNFDGVHRGHMSLISAVLEEGRRLGFKTGAWTFGEHPQNVLSKKKVAYLTTVEEKNKIFAKSGLDYVIYEDFLSVRDYSPEEFADKILINDFDCRCVVCGFNFRFGKNCIGTPLLLREYMNKHGRNIVIVDPVCRLDKIVSSSAIRLFIENGNMEEACEMLGRPYSIDAPVLHGKRLGRTLGLPTINQAFPDDMIMPQKGIYACTCDIDGEIYLGVANVGSRPTVNDDIQDVNCETHILNYDGVLYDKNIKVSFYKKLRDEKKFFNVDSLKAAIEDDICNTVEYFSKNKGIIKK